MGTVNFTEQCTPFSSLQDVENTYIHTPSRSGVQTIATIIINGTPHPITADVSGINVVADVVAVINEDPVVGALVTATAEYDATTGDGKIVVTGKSDAASAVVIADDSTFILNWLYTDADTNEDLAYVSPIKTQTTTNGAVGGTLNQLEPKPATPALDQVYIPLHTEIVSNTPVISNQYWVENATNDSEEVTNGVAVGTHPTTNESVGYFISFAVRYVTVTAKYLGGANTNDLVADYGTGGVLHVPGIPDGWMVPESDPYVYSASIATNPTDGSVYVKLVTECNTIVNGVTKYRYSTIVSKYDRTLTNHLWSRLLSYDDVPDPQYGRTIPTMGRSDGGLAVDSVGNVLAVVALVDFYEDAYAGGVFVEPATLVVKLLPNGDVSWTLPLRHTQSTDNFWNQSWGNIIIDPTQFVNWRYTPCLAVHPTTNDAFVSVGTSIFWISPAGNIEAGLGIGNTDVQMDNVICDIAVGNSVVYAVINQHTSPYEYFGAPVSTLVKFSMSDFTNYTQIFTHDAWSIGKARKRNTAGFGDPNPFSQPTRIAIDSADENIIYGVTSLEMYGADLYTSTPSGDITIFSIDTTSTATIDWASDFKQSTINGVSWPGPMNITEDVVNGQAAIITTSNGMIVTLPLITTANGYSGLPDELSTRSTQMYITKAGATTYAGTSLAYVNVTADMPIASGHILDVVPISVPQTLSKLANLTDSFTTTSVNIFVTDPTIFSMTPLPPYDASVSASLHVQNIAAVGELQLLGLFAPPTSLIGEATDREGMIRIGENGIYCCTADYNGSTNVWQYAAFSGGASVRTIPPGVNTNTYLITGGPGDSVGDIYTVSSGVALVCVGAHDGVTETWKVVSPYFSPSDFNVSRSMQTSSGSNPKYWPDGRFLTGFGQSITIVPKGGSPTSNISNGSAYCDQTASSGSMFIMYGTSASTITMLNYAWDYTPGWNINIVNESTQKLRIVPPAGGYIQGGLVTLRPRESLTLQYIGYYGGQYTFVVVSRSANIPYVYQVNSNTSPTLDFELSNQFHITLTNSYSIPAIARPYSSWNNGDVVEIYVKQMSGFSYTTTWDTSYKFPGGTAPSAPTSGNMHVVRAVRMPSGYFACTVALNVPA